MHVLLYLHSIMIMSEEKIVKKYCFSFSVCFWYVLGHTKDGHSLTLSRVVSSKGQIPLLPPIPLP